MPFISYAQKVRNNNYDDPVYGTQNTTDSVSKAKIVPITANDTSHKDSTATKFKDLFWGSYGYGLVFDAGGLSANYAHNKHLLTLRYGGSFSDFNRVYDEYSLLYGRVLMKKKIFLVSGSAGAGFINSNEEDFLPPGYPNKKYTFNFPIEAQIIFFIENVGIGLKAFANINSFYTSEWGLITLQVGKFK